MSNERGTGTEPPAERGPSIQVTAADYALLADGNTRSAVVEHYVWCSIVVGIFGDGQQQDQLGAWGGIAGVRLHGLCRTLLRKRNRCNCCLSSCAYVPVNSYNLPIYCCGFLPLEITGRSSNIDDMGLREQVLRKLAVREQLKLQLLLPEEKRKDRSTRHALHRDLLSVFGDALGLFSIFIKSRAFFSVRWASELESSKETATYNPKAMEAEVRGTGPNSERHVIFNISPGLYKVGTADGADYNRTMILVKPRVVCD
ncbi:hypothetical protein CcaCcLH18_10945 [Colletotrichum camelliae]|nr:hypothetical protein CcaCcLH18_10945 [Colletotrichum camelliae]